MRSIPLQPLLAACAALLLSALPPHAHAQQPAPVSLTRLYTGADGQSHFERVEVPMTEENGTESPLLRMGDSFVVREQPGSIEDWHNADARRYVVTISGHAEVEVSGGEKRAVEPGEIWLAEDLTGKGHIFRVIGKEQWVALFVNFAK
jgi:quercetin dioxygenase-like cupin family protein